MFDVICVLLAPPAQLSVAAPLRISPAVKTNEYGDNARRARPADSKTLNRKPAAIAAGSQLDSLGSPKDIRELTFPLAVFAVVLTVTVTLSGDPALEFMTYVFNGSLVLIAQLAWGALVLHEK